MANLPPELLYNILGDIVADYIDHAITGSPNPTLPGPQTPTPSFSDVLAEHFGQFASFHNSSSVNHAAVDRHQIPTTQNTASAIRDRLQKHIGTFLHWTTQEAQQPLLENDIIPLLTVNRSFHHVLCKVLDDALGHHERPGDRWAILKELRREFRRTRTSHLPPLPVKTKVPIQTPLMSAYLRVCQAQQFLHEVKALVFDPNRRNMEVSAEFTRFFSNLSKLIPQPVLCGRVKAHMCLARVRLGFVERLCTYSRDIGEALVKAFQALGENDGFKKEATLDSLKKTTQAFDTFETNYQTFTESEGSHLSKNFHVFPSYVVCMVDIANLFDIMADCPSATVETDIEDIHWLDEMSKIQSWGGSKYMKWSKFRENPDYDEMDFSRSIFM